MQRRLLAALSLMCLLSQSLAAQIRSAPPQVRNGWNRVEMIKKRALLLIILRNGQKVRGEFVSADDSTLVVLQPSRSIPPSGSLNSITRESILMVYRKRGISRLPNLRTCTLVGAATLASALAISEGRKYGGGGAMIGAFVGGFGGASLGAMTCGTFVMGALVFELMSPRFLIYERAPDPTQASEHGFDASVP